MKTTGNKKLIFAAFLAIMVLIPFNGLHAQSAPSVILSSYTVSGNALTDDVITFHLVLTNSSQTLDIYDALFSFTSDNVNFFPSYGQSNQFFIPLIKAKSSVEYDLKISVRNAVPDENFQLSFTIDFSIEKTETNSSFFFIKNVVKSTESVQLLGLKPIEAEKLSDNYRVVQFRAAVINQSNFTVQNVVMILEGINFDFNARIPLNNISHGNHAIRYFNLNFVSDDIPEFNVTFQYNDIEGFEYLSRPQKIAVNLKYISLSEDSQTGGMKNVFRLVMQILVILILISANIFFLIKFSRKKGV